MLWRRPRAMTLKDSKRRGVRGWLALLLAAGIGFGLNAGCSTLDEQQRRWIFQPGERTWSGGLWAAEGMQEVWIDLDEKSPAAESAAPMRLHGLWLAQPRADAPVLLYLHGARYDVRGSAPRIRRMHELGFSVLAVDYRGFGRSTPALPSEASATDDAAAAWRWLAQQHPASRRYVFGHSLGAAIAVHLASEVDDAAGLIIEGGFTSISDVASTFRWGWLPFGPFVTQRFDAAGRIARLRIPVLVVHGSEDRLIPPELGRALYERAPKPKRFVLVEGGSHHSTNAVGQPQYRAAIAELFGI